MKQQLKSVFRRSSKSRNSLSHDEGDTHPIKASSPRSDRQHASSNRHGRSSVDSSTTGSVYAGRSRPVSSVYDDHHSRVTTAPDGFVSSTGPIDGAIANDYKAYLPALSPVNDEHANDYLASSDDSHHISGRSKVRHEEDVADRNIARFSGSFDGGQRKAPFSNPKLPPVQHSDKRFDTGSAGPVLSPVRNSVSVGKYSAGQGTVKTDGPQDGTRSHAETIPHEEKLRNRSSFPPPTARVDAGIERKPLASKSVNGAAQLPQDKHGSEGSDSGIRHATVDGTAHGEETILARTLREDGVVDLRNTVDTDGNITWAPAVTHEVVKPHRHEIIQHKIHREIHNYEYFHRIQPVMMTEVLPPRHWIPNPDGEGLIEISAEELPARTGDNRWWSICEHSKPLSQTTMPKYRTEPEIIDVGTYVTEDGFERRETIIIHPPTLADLTGYGGPVQAMHFDHKTGKSWMGELTTMDKLEQLQQELDRAPDSHAFKMNGLAESLPSVHSDSARRSSNPVPPRKPVNRH